MSGWGQGRRGVERDKGVPPPMNAVLGGPVLWRVSRLNDTRDAPGSLYVSARPIPHSASLRFRLAPQAIWRPPFIRRTCPVMNEAWGDSRKAMPAAMLRGVSRSFQRDRLCHGCRSVVWSGTLRTGRQRCRRREDRSGRYDVQPDTGSTFESENPAECFNPPFTGGIGRQPLPGNRGPDRRGH